MAEIKQGAGPTPGIMGGYPIDTNALAMKPEDILPKEDNPGLANGADTGGEFAGEPGGGGKPAVITGPSGETGQDDDTALNPDRLAEISAVQDKNIEMENELRVGTQRFIQNSELPTDQPGQPQTQQPGQQPQMQQPVGPQPQQGQPQTQQQGQPQTQQQQPQYTYYDHKDPSDPNWKSDPTYTAYGQKFYFPQELAPVANTKEREAYYKEVFSRAHGFDGMRDKLDSIIQENKDLSKTAERVQKLENFMGKLAKIVESGNVDHMLRSLKVPSDKIRDFAVQRTHMLLNAKDDTVRNALEEQFKKDYDAIVLQQQLDDQKMYNQQQEEARAKAVFDSWNNEVTHMINTTPEIQSRVSELDQKVGGHGTFRNAVSKFVQSYISANNMMPSPKEAIDATMSAYGQLQQNFVGGQPVQQPYNQAPTQPMIQPQGQMPVQQPQMQQPARQRQVAVPPNLATKSLPGTRVGKSLDSLKALNEFVSQEMVRAYGQ